MEKVSRMAAEVNKLIGGNLIAGQDLYLPQVGSLYIIVDKEGNKRVDFSSAEKGVSLIEVIKDRAGCNPDQAEDIFSRWINEVRTPKAIVINGVGELRGKSFVSEPEFKGQLATGVAEAKPAEAEVAPEPSKEAVVEQTALKEEEKSESTPTPTPAAPAPKKKSKAGLWIVLIIILIAFLGGGYYAYDTVTKTKAEKARIAAKAEAEAAEMQRVADSIVLAQMEAKRLAEAEAALAAAKGPRYRVVYGVYELRSNVDVAIKHINAQFGDDSAHESPFGPLTMVSMFESDERSECQEFLMEYYDLYPDAWIYDSEQ